MPKTNKLMSVPDYVGGGENPEKLLVQKSNPLLSLSETAMTLPELKILDVYLSRINSHEPDKRHVQLEKGELEKLLGVTRIPTKDLEKRIDNLFQVITIRDETKEKGFTKIALFERVECGLCRDGLWKIDLACTPAAMEYIFNVENIGYLKYRLKSIVNLTSRYSYVLYLFLADYCYQGTWEIPLDELKAMLNCNAVTYSEFKEFNKKILKACHKEINEKTDISYTYATIKRGRTVVAISFDVERKADAEPFIDPAKLPMPEPELPKPDKKPKAELKEKLPPRPPLPPVRTVAVNGNRLMIDFNERLNFAAKNQTYFEQICADENLRFYAMYCDYEFLPQEMQKICDLLFTIDVPQEEFPQSMGVQPEEQRMYEFANFLDNMHIKFYSYAQWHKMTRKQRFNYFYKMLENYKEEHQRYPKYA